MNPYEKAKISFKNKKYSDCYSSANTYLQSVLSRFEHGIETVLGMSQKTDKTQEEGESCKLVADILYLRGASLVRLFALDVAENDLTLCLTLDPQKNEAKEALQTLDGYRDVVNAQKRKDEASKVPVTVLTGFLGSGKTTLLNYILSQNHGKKVAIIENEFGAVGIDEMLISKKFIDTTEEVVVEMNNGCICCTVRGDLTKSIVKLVQENKGKPFDGIFIETTGLADPAPVAQTFYVDDNIRELCRLDGIITVVDAKHILQHLDEIKPEGVENESVEQVAFADVILLNKIDLVTVEHVELVKSKIRAINATVKMIETKNSIVDMNEILNIHAFSLDNVLKKESEFLVDQDHQHDESVSSFGIKYDGDIDEDKFLDFLHHYLQEFGVDIFRSKGVLALKGKKRKFVYHAIHMLMDSELSDPWEKDEDRKCQLIFIGRNLDEKYVRECFDECK